MGKGKGKDKGKGKGKDKGHHEGKGSLSSLFSGGNQSDGQSSGIRRSIGEPVLQGNTLYGDPNSFTDDGSQGQAVHPSTASTTQVGRGTEPHSLLSQSPTTSAGPVGWGPAGAAGDDGPNTDAYQHSAGTTPYDPRAFPNAGSSTTGPIYSDYYTQPAYTGQEGKRDSEPHPTYSTARNSERSERRKKHHGSRR